MIIEFTLKQNMNSMNPPVNTLQTNDGHLIPLKTELNGVKSSENKLIHITKS